MKTFGENKLRKMPKMLSPESTATLFSTAVIATATACYYLFSPRPQTTRDRPTGTSLGTFLNTFPVRRQQH